MTLSRLTVFLLQGHASAPADFIRADKTPIETPTDPKSNVTGAFFHVESFPRPPGWVSDITTVLSKPISRVNSASASGVLILQTSSRWFAISFGYGRSLIDPERIQRQFGMRVCLNLIDPSQLRSLDTKTFEDLVVSKSTQSSKSSELPAFGVDVSRDILRGVAGVPRDKQFATRLAGSDPIVLSKTVTADEFPAVCDRLLVAYNDNAYKANFEWVDQLAVVEDSVLLGSLNDLLIHALKSSDTSTTYMAAPETVDWENIEWFSINGTRGAHYEDLDLDEYLATHSSSSLKQLNLEILKQRSVSVKYTRSQQTDRLWNVYQCLISEQQVGGQLYTLIEGRWFAVEKRLSDRVNTFFNSLSTKSSLTAAGPGETEPDYNERVAKTYPDSFLHLDAKIVRPGGAASGIEFCDLLGSDGSLIHIKRKSRSATLSHLFAQGSVSATSLVNDPQFRDEVRKAIRDKAVGSVDKWLDLVPAGSAGVIASNFKVSYVVLTKPLKPGASDWMPFFSKLNLMQHAIQLKLMSFDVSVSRVDN